MSFYRQADTTISAAVAPTVAQLDDSMARASQLQSGPVFARRSTAGSRPGLAAKLGQALGLLGGPSDDVNFHRLDLNQSIRKISESFFSTSETNKSFFVPLEQQVSKAQVPLSQNLSTESADPSSDLEYGLYEGNVVTMNPADDDQEAGNVDKIMAKWDSQFVDAAPRTSTKPSSSKSMLIGIMFVCLAGIFQVTSSTLTQQVLLTDSELSGAPRLPEFLFFRNFPSLIAVIILSRFSNAQLLTLPDFTKREKILYVGRLLLPVILFSLIRLSLEYNSISLHTVIYVTNPFLVSIFAFLFLGAVVNRAELTAMFLCFAAVIVIVTGGAESAGAETADAETSVVAQSGYFAGIFIAFMAALSQALISVSIKRFSKVHWQTQIFQVTALAVVVYAFYQLVQLLVSGEASLLSVTGEQAFLLALLGCSEGGAMACMVMANSTGNLSTNALFSYTNVLYAFLADVLIFNSEVQLRSLLPILFITIVTVSTGLYQVYGAHKTEAHNKQTQNSLDYSQDFIRAN